MLSGIENLCCFGAHKQPGFSLPGPGKFELGNLNLYGRDGRLPDTETAVRCRLETPGPYARFIQRFAGFTLAVRGVQLKKILKRVLLAAAMSWSFSVTLGLLFAVCVSSRDMRDSGHSSFYALRLPAVVPVALITSTVISILITPVAIWSVRTGVKNLLIYAPILWVALATYIFAVLAIWRNAAYGLYGVAFLGAVGAAVLGFIPQQTRQSHADSCAAIPAKAG